jgi:hypothetical protein
VLYHTNDVNKKRWKKMESKMNSKDILKRKAPKRLKEIGD